MNTLVTYMKPYRGAKIVLVLAILMAAATGLLALWKRREIVLTVGTAA